MNQRSHSKQFLILLAVFVAAVANTTQVTSAANPDFPAELTVKTQETSKTLTPKQVYQRMLKSTVWVQQNTGNGMVMNGTGWIVDKSKGLIMTNHHVVKNGEKVQMYMPKFDDQGKLVTNAEDYQRYTRPLKGVVVDSDKTRDLAIIKVEGSLPRNSLELKRAKESPSPADMVHIVGGKPMGSNGVFVYANGYIREVSKGKGIFGGRDIWLIRNTVPTNKGNSGGALVNNQGEVVGVANRAFFTDQIQAVAGGVDLREVNDYLKEVTTLYPPSNAKQNYLVGRRHYFAARYNSANRYFSAAIRLDAKHADAYRMRGFCFSRRNELDQAKQEFTAAIEIDSGNWNAYYGRGVVLRKQGNVDAAIRDHSEAIRLNPEAKYSYVERGDLRHQKRLFENAVKDYTRAIELDPKFNVAMNQRGLSFLDLGLYQKALDDFFAASRIQPKALYFNNGGVALEKMQKLKEASKLYVEATKISPKYFLPWQNLGRIFLEVKNYESAIQHLDMAIRANPKSSRAFYYRAKAFDGLKMSKQALADMDAAISLNPKNADYFAMRSIILNELGYQQDAAKDIQLAAKWNPKKYGKSANQKHITARPPINEQRQNQPSNVVNGTWQFKQVVDGVRYDCVIAFDEKRFGYHLTWIDAAGRPGEIKRRGTYTLTDGGWQVVFRSDNGRTTKQGIGFKGNLLVVDFPDENLFFSFKRIK